MSPSECLLNLKLSALKVARPQNPVKLSTAASCDCKIYYTALTKFRLKISQTKFMSKHDQKSFYF